MAMHRKYTGWSELRPAPRVPWWHEILELAGMVLALMGVAAAVMALWLVLG